MPRIYYLPPAGGGQPYHGPSYGQGGGIHYLPPAGGGQPFRLGGGSPGGYGGPSSPSPAAPPPAYSPPPMTTYGVNFAPRGQVMYSQQMQHPGYGYPGADCPACQQSPQFGGGRSPRGGGGGAAGYGGFNRYAP